MFLVCLQIVESEVGENMSSFAHMHGIYVVTRTHIALTLTDTHACMHTTSTHTCESASTTSTTAASTGRGKRGSGLRASKSLEGGAASEMRRCNAGKRASEQVSERED